MVEADGTWTMSCVDELMSWDDVQLAQQVLFMTTYHILVLLIPMLQIPVFQTPFHICFLCFLIPLFCNFIIISGSSVFDSFAPDKS